MAHYKYEDLMRYHFHENGLTAEEVVEDVKALATKKGLSFEEALECYKIAVLMGNDD